MMLIIYFIGMVVLWGLGAVLFGYLTSIDPNYDQKDMEKFVEGFFTISIVWPFAAILLVIYLVIYGLMLLGRKLAGNA